MLQEKIEKTGSEGKIRINEDLIECGDKKYPYNKIQSVAKVGTVTKSLLVKMISFTEGKNYLLTLGVRTDKLDELFTALERARLSKLDL
jgi:hypothetical protein